MGSAIPRVEVFECGVDLGFPIYAYNRRTTKFGVVTHKGRACFRGQPHHCICTYDCVAWFVGDG